MATAEFIGWLVALDCGEYGQYVGTVKAVDGKALTITLKDALLNGETLPNDTVVSSNKICDLKVLEVNPSAKKKSTPKKNLSVPKRVSKTVVVNSKSKILSKESLPPYDAKLVEAESHNIETNEKPLQKSIPLNSSDPNRIMDKLMIGDKPAVTPQTGIKLLKRGDLVPVKNDEKSMLVDAVQQKKAENPLSFATDKTKCTTGKLKPTTKPFQEKESKKLKKQLQNESVTMSFQDMSNVPTKDIAKTSQQSSMAHTPALNTPPTPTNTGLSGIRLDPHSLISSLASVSVSTINPISKNAQKQSATQDLGSSEGSAPSSSSNLDYKRFGEFKSFKGKQQAVPCALDNDFSHSNSSGRRGGGRFSGLSPSGVPITDFSNGYGKVHKRNRDLSDPINHEEMLRDFDFDGNLALFAKEEVNDTEESEDANVEAPAHVRNFRYDENIVQDATRVTSWTSSMEASLPLKHSGFFETVDNKKVPVLSEKNKKTFLNLVKNKLGSVNYHTRVADRLFSLFSHIVEQFSLRVTGLVVILGSEIVHETLLYSLSLHLSNRHIETKLVDCDLKSSLPFVETVSAKELQAIKNVQFVIILDSCTAERLGLNWLVRIANSRKPAHVIDFECERPGFTFSHALYLGVVNESVHAAKDSDRRPNRFVTDVGVPFTWFEKEASDSLADIFSNTLLVEV